MKPVTKYQADDGSVWDTAKKATERDELFAKCNKIEADILRPKYDAPNTGYANGGGYRQHATGAKIKLFAALKTLGAHLDSDGPIGRLLGRAWCLDDKDREWGQPYFANNPEKGEQIAL